MGMRGMKKSGRICGIGGACVYVIDGDGICNNHGLWKK